MEANRHIVAAMAVVLDNAGKVLLVRTHWRGWEPPGGQIELGEDLITGLQREVREESCCEVEVRRLVGVYSNVGIPESPGQVIFCFLCDYVSGTAAAGCDECIEAGWFAPEDAQRLVFAPANAANLARLRDALANHDHTVYPAYRTRPEYEVYVGREI